MNKILIIDDEPQMRKLLGIALESNKFEVIVASTGKEGIHMAASHQPNLILLDIGLPDMNGQTVLLELRKWFMRPIVILTVHNNESDVVKALDNGASDYLTKPFRTAELLARIRAALRRSNPEEINSVKESGNIKIDFAAHCVWLNGELMKLTSTEFNLLCLLVKNEGRVLTHQFILKEIWGPSYQSETQYLRVFIASLRKKIDHPGCDNRIITETGVGYRFI